MNDLFIYYYYFMELAVIWILSYYSIEITWW